MITKRVRIEKNSGLNAFTFNYLFNGLDLYQIATYPSGMSQFPSPYPAPVIVLYITSNVFTSFYNVGTYSYYFSTGLASPPTEDALLIIEVVDSLTESLTTCTGTGDATLVWINRQGGRSSYTFNQRKDYEFRIGSPNTFDNNGTIKYTYKGKNFYAWTVYKTGITENEMTLITSLRSCIQAWFYDSSNDISTPIIIDNTSFKIGSTKEKLKEVSFSFRFADYQEIQSQ